MEPVPLVPPDRRLTGRWTRSLLTTFAGSGPTTDTTTDVTWLQAGPLYVDLRLPGPAPVATAAACLDELGDGQLADVAAASGFAGRLLADGPWACWERLVDLQPPAGVPDEGSLSDEGDRLVETGRDGSYVEHWHRAPGVKEPVAAALLRERTSGAPAVVVRVGDDVGWARGRSAPLPTGAGLLALVSEHGRAVLDTEVALGHLGPAGALRTRSNLPWQVGTVLPLRRDGDGLATEEPAPDGSRVHRRWQVVQLEGELDDLPLTPAEGPA